MQLDQTRIAIRERTLLETLDLALLVLREFFAPIAMLALLAIIPLALINYALIGWMAPGEFDESTLGLRFMWNMALLVYLEAPLASVFVIAYLGPAVFLEQRTWRQVVADVFRVRPSDAGANDGRPLAYLILCQGLIRGVLVAWLLYLCLDRSSYEGFNGLIEGFLMFVLVCCASSVRAFRPYINELIVLERNPLWSSDPNAITLGKRSAHLHGPYSGDLVIRYVGMAATGAMLLALALVTVVALQGILVSDWPFHFSSTGPDNFSWNLDWFKLQVIYPMCLWLVVVVLAVARFLSYLDLRIRHEGWEIELLMRAEGLKLAMRVE